MSATPSNPRWDTAFFGHPRGLSTLFFTEMWERFSYYGMRALLILFMTATVEHGGLGFPVSKAGAIYGLYTAMVYLLALPGGWFADRIAGQRRAVLWGGIVIALGHYSMAIPRLGSFYLGLAMIAVGTGLLKPNISTMVGALYTPEDHRRDAGFSIFYMGINVGALLSPLVCGYLGENINWHYGFGAAGVGMTLGMIQYILGGKYLGKAGVESGGNANDRRLFRLVLAAGASLLAAAVVALFVSGFSPSAEDLSDVFGIVELLIVVVLFGWLLTAKGYSPVERRRFAAILVLFLGATLFWAASEQAGSTLNLFAERQTNLHAWDFPLWAQFRASYFQSFNSVFVVAMAPFFAWLWVRLGPKEPSSTAKFAWGLFFVALSFVVLVPVAASSNVSPWWLTLSYFLATVGELCLSPVGLSAMTKLAPARAVGLIMGIWFLAASAGNYVAGRAASASEKMPLPTLFTILAGACVALGVIMIFLIRPMKHLSEGVN